MSLPRKWFITRETERSRGGERERERARERGKERHRKREGET